MNRPKNTSSVAAVQAISKRKLFSASSPRTDRAVVAIADDVEQQQAEHQRQHGDETTSRGRRSASRPARRRVTPRAGRSASAPPFAPQCEQRSVPPTVSTVSPPASCEQLDDRQRVAAGGRIVVKAQQQHRQCRLRHAALRARASAPHADRPAGSRRPADKTRPRRAASAITRPAGCRNCRSAGSKRARNPTACSISAQCIGAAGEIMPARRSNRQADARQHPAAAHRAASRGVSSGSMLSTISA